MANELVARRGLRVSGSTFISTVNTDQSLLSNVLTIDPSNNEVKDLSLATFAADFITGGTLSGTGNKDLVLEQYDGTSVTISDVNIETTGGTYTSSTGIIEFTQNDGSTFNVSGWDYLESASISANDITLTDNLANDTVLNIDAITGATFDLASGDITWEGSNNFDATLSLGTDFVTGVTEADNVVTITKNGGASSNFTIDAITGLGYDNDWALSGTSTGVSAPAVELPFITGGTFNAGSGEITLGINGGLESDITITGLSALDTFVTGGTVVGETLTLTRNDNQDVVVTGFSFDIDGDNSGGGTIEMGDTLTFIGGTGMTVNTDGANPGSVTVILNDTAVSTGSYGAADTVATFTVDQQGRLTAASDVTIDITASQVSDFDAEVLNSVFEDANFVDSSNIDFTVTSGTSVTADLTDTGVVAGNYGSDSQVAVFDVDAKGRITAVSGETINGANIDNNDIVISAPVGTATADLAGTQFLFTSSDNSITIVGDNSNGIDFVVTDSTDTKITGGTYTDATGVLTLTDNDGTVITVDGEWNHCESAAIAGNVITFTSNTGETSNVTVAAVTGGTFDAATGIITVEGSGTLSNIDLGTDFVTGVTEADNVITVGNAGGGTTDYTIQAVTAVTYNNDWDIALDGTGSLGTTPVELPFITGGTYSSGTITLGVNGGLESDIAITGLTNTDTHVTGATVAYTGATLELNQSAPDVLIDSEQTIRVTGGAGVLFGVNISDYKAVHVEYTIVDGANARSGFFTAVFHAGTVEFSDWSTMDIGTVVGDLSANASGDVIYTGGGTVTANTRAIAI